MTDEVSSGRDPSRPPVGGRHRRTLVMAGVVLLFLAVVLVVGVIRGRPEPTPRPSGSASAPSSSAATTGPPLQLTGVRCAALDGTALTVGFEVVNNGSAPLSVSELEPSFPLGGLTPDPEGAPDGATCPSTPVKIPYFVGPGARVVLAFVATPTDPRCLGPLPVDVKVDYDVDGGGSYADTLHAFPDLGGFGLPSSCS